MYVELRAVGGALVSDHYCARVDRGSYDFLAKAGSLDPDSQLFEEPCLWMLLMRSRLSVPRCKHYM